MSYSILSRLAGKCLSLLLKATIRSSRSQMFFKIIILKKLRNIHRKNPLLFFLNIANFKLFPHHFEAAIGSAL